MQLITRRSFSAGAMLSSVLATRALAASVAASAALPSLSDIRDILAGRVAALSAGQDSIGMVAGVIGPKGRGIVTAGRRDKGDSHALTGDTAFEFGSVAKVFTALLYADMLHRREVVTADPVARYLPKVNLQMNGRFVLLDDLATHMSGLPFMPALPAKTGAYTDADLYAFLAFYRPTRDPGAEWEYSNLGYWLLGEALAEAAGKDFKTLVRERILHPLKMAHTDFGLSPAMKADLATGHDASLQPSPPLSDVPIYDLMPAAGAGFYSTANDALTFLSAAMGYLHSPLAPAFALATGMHVAIAGSSNLQALGWTLTGDGSDRLVLRDGGTLGSASCLAWDRGKRIGVVVLANVVSDVSDIARHALRPDFPLAKPSAAVTHTEIALDAAILARYAGHYAAEGEGTFTVSLEGDHLEFEAPAEWGLPKLRIRPESKQGFFAAELPLRVGFQTGADGSATGITVYPPRGQKGIAAKRSD